MQRLSLAVALLSGAALAAPPVAGPPGLGLSGGSAPGGPPLPGLPPFGVGGGLGPQGPGSSGSSTYNASTAPTQQRLAFHGPHGMTVSWSTLVQLENPEVQYGLDPHALPFRASSNESITFPTSSKWHNHVVLSNLLPSTKYYYRVSNSPANETYSFETARVAGDPRPLRVGLFADMGTMGDLGLSTHLPPGVGGALNASEINTIQRLEMDAAAGAFEFVVGGGDYSYADYWLKEEILGYLPENITDGGVEYDRIDQAFWDEMQPLTANLPLMVSPGNHEADCLNGSVKKYNESICPVGQTNFTSYKNRFRMNDVPNGAFGNFWYSYDYGSVHFLHFTTETDFPGAPDQQPNSKYNDGPEDPSNPGAQLAFIKQDLASVDRRRTPWIVAVGHRPWYTAVPASSLCGPCQQAFEPLFTAAGVDVVFQGHVHASVRMDPIANNVTDPAGLNNPSAPWYITSGAAGHFDGLDSLASPLPSYVAYAQNYTYAYSRMTFYNATHLQHDFISSADGSVLDSAILYKKH